MASLGNLTKRVAMAPVNAVTGTAKFVGKTASNIGSMVGGAISQNLGLASFKPSNIFRSTVAAAGLGGIIPMTLGAGGGKGGGGKGAAPTTPTTAAQPGAPVAGMATINIESLLGKLVDVNSKMLETLTSISDTLQQNNNLLSKQNNQLNDLAGLIRQQTLAQIEARREAAQQKAGAPGGQAPADPTKGKGGILSALGGVFSGLMSFFSGLMNIFSGASKLFSGILSLAGSFIGALGSVFSFLSSIGSVLLNLGKFLLRFAGPIAAVAAILFSLESKDWEAFFGKFTDAFNALLEGDFLTAIVNVVTAIPELLIKGIGRLMANIIEFFGFKDAADAIRNFLDTFDLAKIIKDALNFIWDMVKGAFKAFTDFFSNFFEGWDIITPIKDAFNWMWDGITGLFTRVKDAVADILSFDLVGTIGNAISSVVNAVWNFFKDLPKKAADFIESLLPDWVKSAWRKLFGGGGEANTGTPPPNPTPIQPRAAAPAAAEQPAAQQQANANPLNLNPENPPPGINVGRTGSGDTFFMNREGQQVGFIPGTVTPTTTRAASANVTPTTPVQPSTAEAFSGLMGTMIKAVEGKAELTDVMGAGLGVLGAGVNEFNQRSVNSAASKELEVSQPVVINNTAGASGGQQEGSSAQRSSGAARTSVQQSHIDRALYGIAYGSGYA